jgi:hypothetical protein
MFVMLPGIVEFCSSNFAAMQQKLALNKNQQPRAKSIALRLKY